MLIDIPSNFSKTASRLVVALSAVMFLAVPAAIASENGVPEGNADFLPGIVRLPFHWSLGSVDVSFPTMAAESTAWGATNAIRLYSGDWDRSGIATGGRGVTASPLEKSVLRSEGETEPLGIRDLGLFGSGICPWGKWQAVALREMSERPELHRHAMELALKVYFRNFGDRRIILRNLSVPVFVDGVKIAEARPADESYYERGISFPATTRPKSYVVEFVARIPANKTTLAIDGMMHKSPFFKLEAAQGVIKFVGEDKVELPLEEFFGEISKKTVMINVVGSGQVFSWRVAKRLGKRALSLNDWAVALNERCFELYDRPFWFEENGMLLSLAGWDSGYWGKWWNLSDQKGRGLNWRYKRLTQDISLELFGRPPRLQGRDFKRLFENARHPVALHILGEMEFARGAVDQSFEIWAGSLHEKYPPAEYRVGSILLEGDAEDRHEGIGLIDRAAQSGYAPALTEKGLMNLRGNDVVARNLAAGYALIARAASQDFAEGVSVHALCLLRGIGTGADELVGREALLRAARMDEATAQYACGIQLLEQNPEAGTGWILCAAQNGYAKAQHRYAEMLTSGKNVRPDQQAALFWYKAAAEQGDPKAQLELGRAYRSGRGVRQDNKVARRLFLQSAVQGNAEAQTWYGLDLLRDRRSSQAERVEGVEWISKAADSGYLKALYLRGIVYYTGFGGVERRTDEALRYFRMAADEGHLESRVFMAFCYYQGEGVQKDHKKAYEQFKVAAEAGSPVAQIWLAYCYREGYGVDVDLEKAREWAQKAWRQKHPGGLEMLRRIPKG